MLSSTSTPRKAKVNLADYSFRRDIETRLLLAQLSVIEVEILREIIYHSLKISIEQLAEEIDMPVKDLLPILDKLSLSKLFKRQNMTLLVDKEMRKYFEVKIEKFDEDFRPDLDFLQSILNKISLHVLPLWYAIPRSSDNIFESIIEKYFLTPKIYRQYLDELQFDDPLLVAITQEVYQAPDFKITVSELMYKLNLTHQCLEEYLLLLEYHFICCLSYQQVGNRWEEIVTPFAEWHEYLQFEVQSQAQPIRGSIEKHQQVEFQFIEDLTTFLKACQSKKISPGNVKILSAYTPFEQETIINKLTQLEFIKRYATGQIIATERGKTWLSKSLLERVDHLAHDPRNTIANVEEFSSLWTIRNLQLIEKSLRQLIPNEWVEFNDFLRGFIAPIGDKEPITLKNKGKKWKYELPTYTNKEKDFIQAIIMERLTELGIVETGLFRGELCFCLTSFGNRFIH